MSVQARISTIDHCPIYPLASYLYQLLRPLFDDFSRSTTCVNAGDFIQKLQQYCIQTDALLPRTNFVTFKLDQIHERISHNDILTALNQFLITRPTNVLRHQGLSNDTIEELTRLFLQNITFSYDKKVYVYTKGCSLNFRLSRVLLNIYLHYWQTSLLRQIRLADEFYVRYYDTGFFTWYGSNDILQNCFDELSHQYPDVQLTRTIGSHVHFLNAYVENRRGHLYTRVHHDPQVQPFLMPYVTGHPRLIHRQWFRYSLIRAGQLCSTLEDFQKERLYTELTFLSNGYSLNFVEYHLEQFYQRFNGHSRQPSILNQNAYVRLRRELFRCLDAQKRQFEEHEQLRRDRRLIELYYLFDWGSRLKFNQDFRRLWFSIIEQDPKFKQYGLKVKLTTKQCYLSSCILSDC
jgi:hypothetical protein